MKEIIYFHRSKDENYNIVDKAKENNINNADNLLYLGYEVAIEVEILDGGIAKLLSVQGKDVSDKNILI